jgi:hypothetical protein
MVALPRARVDTLPDWSTVATVESVLRHAGA